jgi:hypothetical protein
MELGGGGRGMSKVELNNIAANTNPRLLNMNIAVQKSSHEFSKNSQPNHRSRSGDLLQSLLFG